MNTVRSYFVDLREPRRLLRDRPPQLDFCVHDVVSVLWLLRFRSRHKMAQLLKLWAFSKDPLRKRGL